MGGSDLPGELEHSGHAQVSGTTGHRAAPTEEVRPGVTGRSTEGDTGIRETVLRGDRHFPDKGPCLKHRLGLGGRQIPWELLVTPDV